MNSGRSFIAFFGTRRADLRFTVQINGHHLAINSTFDGDDISPTPAVTGARPVEIDMDGARLRPMLAKTQSVSALLTTLSARGLAQTRIGAVDDVRVGTGASDCYPGAEGMIVTQHDPSAQVRRNG